jgi:hypothetical protein
MPLNPPGSLLLLPFHTATGYATSKCTIQASRYEEYFSAARYGIRDKSMAADGEEVFGSEINDSAIVAAWVDSLIAADILFLERCELVVLIVMVNSMLRVALLGFGFEQTICITLSKEKNINSVTTTSRDQSDCLHLQ